MKIKKHEKPKILDETVLEETATACAKTGDCNQCTPKPGETEPGNVPGWS